ncbi:uncharacterized protein LOC131244544 [Magnolia sinica]|uniref:uncharacterized protein LOC131244544 n=1 Tax=Magnolia sinica TaxID=86752 RepID=UPI002657C18F|nr:uncharacterized protein LOC131244544 [Magnolia sinica]XP_058100068.1 uncharacterized protein LOC131244544 [Magnolia sinica]
MCVGLAMVPSSCYPLELPPVDLSLLATAPYAELIPQREVQQLRVVVDDIKDQLDRQREEQERRMMDQLARQREEQERRIEEELARQREEQERRMEEELARQREEQERRMEEIRVEHEQRMMEMFQVFAARLPTDAPPPPPSSL